MIWEDYLQLYDAIVSGENVESPYDKDAYVNYVTLNQSRQNRWLKRGSLNEELAMLIKSLDKKQSWILITEPWCGDASHLAPFIYKLSQLSSNIDFTVNLRDGNESMIQNYLTNGGMSIPILVVRDEAGKDIFHWGPRPDYAQDLYLRGKNDTSKSPDEKKMELQVWYNKNKGIDLQEELLGLYKD